jgi:fido (protein-threonine AMPylation protein)
VPDWDEDSPQLRHNLSAILEEIVDRAGQRETPSVEMARRWQRRFMQDLKAEPRYVGKFRGEPGLERTGVKIGAFRGVAAAQVFAELKRFETRLKAAVKQVDRPIPAGAALNADQCDAVIDLCAWAHAEWVRIHPFANGNGRTARLWANFLALRYGLPPFVRLRPRPDDGYGDAGAQAMRGNWEPTSSVFRRLLKRFLDEFEE